ncbi:MAG: EAL domain-containing protein [Arenimonas sp.]
MDLDARGEHLLAYQPIALASVSGRNRMIPMGGLLLKYDLAPALAQARDKVRVSTLREVGLAFLAWATVMLILRRWLSQPLECLQAAVSRISEGDFATKVAISGRGELAELGAAIDRMQADLGVSIAERDLSTAALLASERRFKAIFDAEPECVKVMGPNGELLEMNPAGLAMLEADSLDEIRSRGLIGLIVPEYRAAFAALHSRAMRGKSGVLEFEVIGLRGTRRWLETHTAPLPDADGNMRMALGITRDITGRKASEKALRQLSGAVEQTADHVIITDRNGVIEYVNAAFEKTTGYAKEEVLGKTPRLMKSDKLNAAFYQRLWRTILAGEVFRAEFINKKKNGDNYHEEKTITPIRDANGVITHFVSTGRDITERTRAEQWRQHYSDTLGLIAAEAPLTTVLESLAIFAEQQAEGTLCSILLLSADGKRLLHGAAPSLPTFFNQAIDGVAIGPDVGSCGATAFTGRMVIVEDVMSHANWAPWRALATQAELRACWSHPILSAAGRVLGTFAIYRRQPSAPSAEDLELIRQSASLAAIALERAQLHEDRRLAKVVFEQSIEGIMVADKDDRVLMVNQSFERLTGYSAAEVVGHIPNILDPGHDDPALHATRQHCLASTGRWRGELWGRKKSGEIYPLAMSTAIVNDAGGTPSHFLYSLSDVSDQKFQAARIEQLAFYDSLTGLPNRALFLDRLEQTLVTSIRRGGHGAILFLDLDRFKEINDSQGHAVGDLALAEVARRFQETARKEETLARLGGDEFVLIAEDADVETAIRIATRLQSALAEPLDLMGHAYSITTSIGIAFYPADAQTSEDLIKRTDIAMYRAKTSGGGGYRLYQPEMGAALESRLNIAQRLVHALEAGTLELFYQPQIDLASGRVIGAEALLRWHDPELGWVGPAEFIPIAEERGLMVPLGDWVLKEACRQINAWAADGLRMDGRLAINVSALQMEVSDIVARLLGIVREANLGPELFELELTESSMMVDPERAVEILEMLGAAGFNLSIDDFGTGYSSLAYLKRFAVDQIKIDISFIRNMLTDSNDHAIVTTIIAMARSLGLKTTAEGVEEAGQAAALLSLGCDFAQGYHFGRPEPADLFMEKWLKPAAVV